MFKYACMLAVLIMISLAPGIHLTYGASSSTKPLVVAWIYKVTPQVYDVIKENHEYISWISPDWFVLKDNGSIGVFTDRGANDLNLINLASQYGIKIHPMVVSNVPERMHQLFTNPAAFHNFSSTLIKIAQTYGYNGFNIDFEAPMLEDAQTFAQFLSRLAYVFHKAGLKLTVDVAAKRMAYSTNSFLGAYDYKALGQSGVDYIMIMTYDYYELKGVPRPVAPPSWVEACVKYALNYIPRNKLLMGIPSYGWEWTKDGKLVDWHMYDYISNLIKERGLKPVFDQTYKEKYLDLGTTAIYYNDHETVVYKAIIARKYKLPGVAVWRLDGGDPLIWKAIYDTLIGKITPSTTTTTTTSTAASSTTSTTTTSSTASTTTTTTSTATSRTTTTSKTTTTTMKTTTSTPTTSTHSKTTTSSTGTTTSKTTTVTRTIVSSTLSISTLTKTVERGASTAGLWAATIIIIIIILAAAYYYTKKNNTI